MKLKLWASLKMKFRFILSLLVLLMLSGLASAQNGLDALNDEGEQAIDEWSDNYLKRVDELLNKRWQHLILAVEERASPYKAKLIAEQRAWISFKDDACEPLIYAFAPAEKTILNRTRCQAAILEDRIIDLEYYYQILTDDDKLDRLMDLSDSEKRSLFYSEKQNYKAADIKLNEIYSSYMNNIGIKLDLTSDEDASSTYRGLLSDLKAEQRLWVDFKEKSCALFKNGDLRYFEYGCLSQLTEERYRQLLDYGKLIEEILSYKY